MITLPINKMMILQQKAKLLFELTLAKYSQQFYHSHLYRHRVLAVNITGAYICFTLMKDTVSHFMSVAELAMQLEIPLVVNLFDTTPYFFKQTEQSRKEKWLHDPGQIAELVEKLRTLKRRRPQSLYHGYVEVEYCGKYFTDPLQKSIPCAASQQRICVDACGNVYGGCWSMEPFGNLTTVSLSEIVDSEAYCKSHRDMFYKN